jgi:hypothetical protein
MYKLIVAGIFSMLIVGIVGTVGQAEDDVKPKENAKTFMRLKLRHAQEVLEGLTVENYDQIAQGSQDISLLSLAVAGAADSRVRSTQPRVPPRGRSRYGGR